LKKAKNLNEQYGISQKELDEMMTKSETDSVDELMLQNLGSSLMNRKKFRIDNPT
jgi:hypothetical protein